MIGTVGSRSRSRVVMKRTSRDVVAPSMPANDTPMPAPNSSVLDVRDLALGFDRVHRRARTRPSTACRAPGPRARGSGCRPRRRPRSRSRARAPRRRRRASSPRCPSGTRRCGPARRTRSGAGRRFGDWTTDAGRRRCPPSDRGYSGPSVGIVTCRSLVTPTSHQRAGDDVADRFVLGEEAVVPADRVHDLDALVAGDEIGELVLQPQRVERGRSRCRRSSPRRSRARAPRRHRPAPRPTS